jgi:hypothetical protein
VECDSPSNVYVCRKKDEYLSQQILEAVKNEKSISRSKVPVEQVIKAQARSRDIVVFFL